MADKEGLRETLEAWRQGLPFLTWEKVSRGRPDRVAIALFGDEGEDSQEVRSLALHARTAGARLERFADPLTPGAVPLFSHKPWEDWVAGGVDTVLLAGKLSFAGLIYGGLLGRVVALQKQPLLRTILPLAQLNLSPSGLELPCLQQLAKSGVEVIQGVEIP
ncbi:MAG: hypothetical protein QJR00_07990 [Bacillota bacterium]|nr:hypothetical protein [Bacillota bacterium]